VRGGGGRPRREGTGARGGGSRGTHKHVREVQADGVHGDACVAGRRRPGHGLPLQPQGGDGAGGGARPGHALRARARAGGRWGGWGRRRGRGQGLRCPRPRRRPGGGGGGAAARRNSLAPGPQRRGRRATHDGVGGGRCWCCCCRRRCCADRGKALVSVAALCSAGRLVQGLSGAIKGLQLHLCTWLSNIWVYCAPPPRDVADSRNGNPQRVTRTGEAAGAGFPEELPRALLEPFAAAATAPAAEGAAVTANEPPGRISAIATVVGPMAALGRIRALLPGVVDEYFQRARWGGLRPAHLWRPVANGLAGRGARTLSAAAAAAGLAQGCGGQQGDTHRGRHHHPGGSSRLPRAAADRPAKVGQGSRAGPGPVEMSRADVHQRATHAWLHGKRAAHSGHGEPPLHVPCATGPVCPCTPHGACPCKVPPQAHAPGSPRPHTHIHTHTHTHTHARTHRHAQRRGADRPAALEGVPGSAARHAREGNAGQGAAEGGGRGRQ
jgi:hypothetical protein